MTTDIELRDQGDGTVSFEGYACTTNQKYDMGSYSELVLPGAFRRTLGENPDCVMLVSHEGLPLARTHAGTLTLSEDEVGLRVAAQLDAGDPEVQALQRKYARGDLDGQMSFAFRVTDQTWNESHDLRTIRSVTVHRGDVSIVVQGANPTTSSVFRGVSFAGERAKRAETLGTQLRGIHGGRIVSFGGLQHPVVEQRASRRAIVPDYTSRARHDLDLLLAREGYGSFEAWRRANPSTRRSATRGSSTARGPYAAERAWLEQQRAKAGC